MYSSSTGRVASLDITLATTDAVPGYPVKALGEYW